MLGPPQLFLFRGQQIERADEVGPREVGIDHVVDVATLGGEPRCEIFVLVFLLVAKALLSWRSSVDDLDGSLRTHDGDFGRWPGKRDVVADSFGVHDDVGSAIGFSGDQADPWHVTGGVGEGELCPMANHPAPLYVLTR